MCMHKTKLPSSEGLGVGLWPRFLQSLEAFPSRAWGVLWNAFGRSGKVELSCPQGAPNRPGRRTPVTYVRILLCTPAKGLTENLISGNHSPPNKPGAG